MMTPEEKEAHFQELCKLLGYVEPTGNVCSMFAPRRATPKDGPNAIGSFSVLISTRDEELENKKINKHLENKQKL